MTLPRRFVLSSLVAVLAIPGFASTIKHRAATPPSSITVNVTGVVRDSATGLPISGAVATAEGHHSSPTGTNGQYTIAVTKNRTVLITVDQFAYNSVTQSVFGQQGATLDFALVQHSTVTIKLQSGETHQLDYPSTQFAYLITFSGYIHGDNANWCKADGTTITPDKSEIRKITGPGQSVNFPTCCTLGPVITVNVEMKNGDKFPVYFNDSCYGNDVDFYGRDPASQQFLYFKFLDIAEIDFP